MAQRFIRQRVAMMVVVIFAAGFVMSAEPTPAATIFVNGSAAFGTLSMTAGNCAHTDQTYCSAVSPSPCTCRTANAPLVQQNLASSPSGLSSIEAGSYTVHLELLEEPTVRGLGVCSSGSNINNSCINSNDCGSTCSKGTCVDGSCTNAFIAIAVPNFTCNTDSQCTGCFACTTSGLLCEDVGSNLPMNQCTSDADCGGTPVCQTGTGLKYFSGYAVITNATTGHNLVFTFNGAGSGKQASTVASKDTLGVSGAGTMISGTGKFSSYAGELAFNVSYGPSLAKGGASAAPAIELSVNGGLHTP